MAGHEKVERATKAERRLIKAEEEAERVFLKAQAKHAKVASALAKAEKKALASSGVLENAEEKLRTAQQDRAAGPVEKAEPASE